MCDARAMAALYVRLERLWWVVRCWSTMVCVESVSEMFACDWRGWMNGLPLLHTGQSPRLTAGARAGSWILCWCSPRSH